MRTVLGFNQKAGAETVANSKTTNNTEASLGVVPPAAPKGTK